MADDGSQQRKPDFRTAVEDVKALAKVLATEPQFVLGRRLNFRSPAVLAAIGVVTTLVLALMVVLALLRTGGTKAVSDNAALIGALVALGGVLTAQMVSIALDDRRTQESRELEDRRTQEARELEAQRANEAALQNYFEQVGTLLIEKSLREASPGDNLSTIVRAQTLAVLEGLDSDRKRLLLLFLHESGLIDKDKLVVSLEAANLRGAKLHEADLRGANLQVAKLHKADLRGANLREADLSGANLRNAAVNKARLGRADLSGAQLRRAKLHKADLSGANLLVANLIKADLRRAYLSEAFLRGAFLDKADLRGADLRGADLRGADLSKADLREAILRGADLRRAILRGADLRGADLREADLRRANLREADLRGAILRGAAHITNEKLEHQAYSLEGATMPDGSIHD